MGYVTQASCEHMHRPRAALYRPLLALVVYAASRHDQQVLAHPIEEGGGREAVLGAARALSRADVNAVGRALGQAQCFETRPNTLAVGPGLCAWWVDPGARTLIFAPAYEATRSLCALNDTPIPLPGLVLVCAGRALSVFAVRGEDRPELDTPLCHAPLWNLFDGGRMCQGSVPFPKSVRASDQEAWEAALFQSAFTHPSRTRRDTHWEASYEELLRRAVDDGAFPQTVLMDAGLTLRQVLQP
ncbi:PRTRC system protein B [Deinococcus frigens]